MSSFNLNAIFAEKSQINHSQIDHSVIVTKVVCLLRNHETFLIQLIKNIMIYSSIYLLLVLSLSKKLFFTNHRQPILYDRSYNFFKRLTLKSRAHPPTC